MMKRAWLVLACAVFAAQAAGCHDSRRTQDSNTNWLRGCESTAECGAGELCACGVCTVACVEDAMCEAPGQPEAFCVEVEEDRCEGASRGAVCLERCERDLECRDGLSCIERACRLQTNAPPDAGGSETMDASNTALDAEALPADAGSEAATDSAAIADAARPGEIGEACGADLGCSAGLSCEEGTCRSPWSGAGCEPGSGNRPACDEEGGCAGDLVCHVDGTCIEPGQCDWSGRATLARIGDVGQLLSDATHLYWRDRGSEDALGNHLNDGAILRLNLADRAVETLVTGLGPDDGLLIDADSVYWIKRAPTGPNSELWSAPKEDSTDSTLLLSGEIRTWGQDGSYVYYTQAGNALARVRKDTGAIEPLQGVGDWSGPILVDSAAIYFNGSSGGIESVPLAGGAPTPVPDSMECILVGLGRSEIHCLESFGSTLRSLSKSADQSLNLALNVFASLLSIVAYGDHLYFPRFDGDDFDPVESLTWKRAPRVPGEIETLPSATVLPAGSHALAITVDDRGLFWARDGSLVRLVIADYQMASGPAQGAAGGPCYGDLSCDSGLSCVDTLCE